MVVGHDESGVRHDRGSENVPILWVVRHPIDEFLVSRNGGSWKRLSHGGDTTMRAFLGRESVLDQVAPDLQEDVVTPAQVVKLCLRRAQEGVGKHGRDEHRRIQQRIEHVRLVSPYRVMSTRWASPRRSPGGYPRLSASNRDRVPD
jgi:hypothetical protein